MEKNDVLKLDIVDLGMDGEGIAKPEGYVVFVPGALTGERVEAKILKAGKNFAYAKLSEILKPSPERVEPPCAVFGKCGGCALMNMSYDAQLRFKRKSVENCFRKAGLQAEVGETVPSAKTFSCRNKLQLPVSPNGIGFFRENSHDVVNIDTCPAEESSGKVIEAVRGYMEKSGDPAYDETTASGNIRHIIMRVSGGQKLFTVVSAEGKLKDEKLFTEILKKRFPDFGLFVNTNSKSTNAILGREYRHIYGLRHLTGEMHGIKYKITPDAFTQTNDDIASKIYAKTAELIRLSGAEVVIDAYSGISVLSAVISRFAKTVYAIEINREAHAAAEEVKRENGVKNLTNILGDIAVELPKLLADFGQSAAETSAAAPSNHQIAVILDPPRKGCDAGVLDALLTARPGTIIYISCNPATLSRDLAHLALAYEIISATPFDMFPQTRHVETLICLQLK